MRHGILSEDPGPTVHENESRVRCLAGVSVGAIIGSLFAWGVSGYAAGVEEMMMVAIGFITGSTATLVVGWQGGIGRRHALLAGSVAFGALTLGLFIAGLLTPGLLPLHILTVLPGTLLGALAGGAILQPIRRHRGTPQSESGGCPFTPVPDDVVVIHRQVVEQMANRMVGRDEPKTRVPASDTPQFSEKPRRAFQ